MFWPPTVGDPVSAGDADRTTEPVPVDVVTPVPPFATGNAEPEYESVSVPEPVTGELVTVKMAGAAKPTLVTVPPPPGDAQEPSPRRNVVLLHVPDHKP
jgi:hypothetical protein